MASHQLAVFDGDEIEGWGSGFILKYKERIFFITCDHVIHLLDDYANGERANYDFTPYIITNYSKESDEINTCFMPIGRFNYFDKKDFKIPELTDLVDVAFAEMKMTLEAPIWSHALHDYDGKKIVEEKKNKIIIEEDKISEVSKDKTYVLTGSVENQLVDGIRIDRKNKFVQDIKYEGGSHFGYIELKTPEPTSKKEWEGLSGSPVFSEDGKLVGMLNEVVEGENTIHITPIGKITKFIDYVIATEDNRG